MSRLQSKNVLGRPASPKGKSAKSPGAPGTSNGAAALGPRVGPEGQQNDRDSQPAGQSTDVLLAEHRASGLHKRGTRFSSKTGADVCNRPSLLSDISLYSESLFKHVPVTVTNENQFDSSDDVDTSHVHHHVHHYLHHSPGEASTSINFKEDDFSPWAEEYPVLTPDFYDEYGRVTHSQTKQRQRLQSLEEKLDIQAKQFFHIDRVLWRSYYSIVLAGIFRASGQMVAIKIVKKNTDEEQLSHILTEHKVLANHSRSCPFIVRLHSAFQTRLHCYLIMEFVEGGSLDDRLSVVGVYPERVAVFYLAEISLAMFFLHKRGILHRDLRLKNVMLKSDGHVRIIDFGLSKMNWKDSNKFEVVGTLKEMAPEMHQNTPYNKAVDYWSVGLILYALVHGELPFKGKTRVDIFKAVTIEKEKYNNNLNANTTVALCKELLRKNQKRRLGYEDDSETVMKSHPFFADVNWVRMERRLYTPPYMPITDMDDESGVTESTWPDLSEQNAVFDGKEVPRRLSLALGDASLNHQVPKIVVKPIKNGTFDPSDIVPVRKLSGGVLVQPRRGSHSVDGKRVFLDTSPRDQEPTEQSQMKVDSAVNLQKNVEFKPVAQNDLLLLSPVDNWEITSVGKDFTVFTLNKPPTPEKQSCLRGCWAECSYKCHVEAATCRALCCGLENVKPPHKLQRERAPRPSIILTQPTSATEV